jgi:hypothetical protein
MGTAIWQAASGHHTLLHPNSRHSDMSWRNRLVTGAIALSFIACDKNERSRTEVAQDASVNLSAQRRGVSSGLGTGGGGGGGVGGVGPGGAAFGVASPVAVAAAPPPVATESEMLADTTSAPSTVAGTQSTPLAQADAASAMIIRTGSATIKVDSLELAVARLRSLAQSLGGYVGNTSIQTGQDQMRSASVEIKVPSSRWGQLLAGIKPIGVLEQQDESAQDVGEEFVDMQARMANARRLEERLITLLANRTGKLSDVLAVERELARVREEIERYEGRMRYLKTRSAISTMMVVVHEPGPVLGNQPGESPIGDAFRNAWRLFVGLVAFVISSLGVSVPIAVVLGGLIWWRRSRRRE